jgi:hypothetical protein
MADFLKDVDDAFTSDPMINELGIIMSSPPPNLILIDHKLGLSCKILKPLFSYAIDEFHSILNDVKYGRKELSNMSVQDDILRLTRAILLVKGDMPMAYNLRKQLLVSSLLLDVDNELLFLSFLFSHHPKSPSSWQHRRWCLNIRNSKNKCNKGEVKVTTFLSDVEMNVELDLCTIMSEKYPKNYYSWLHRLWLLQGMNIVQLESELKFSLAWLVSHVSDHSAASHRYQIIFRIISLISKGRFNENNHTDTYQELKLETFVATVINDLKTDFKIKFIMNDINESYNDSDKRLLIKNMQCTNLYYQFVFIEYVLRKSEYLILHRPGEYMHLFISIFFVYNAYKHIYMYIHIYICIYMYIHIYIYVYTYTHICICLFQYFPCTIHMYIYIYIYIYIHIHMYVCMVSLFHMNYGRKPSFVVL